MQSFPPQRPAVMCKLGCVCACVGEGGGGLGVS